MCETMQSSHRLRPVMTLVRALFAPTASGDDAGERFCVPLPPSTHFSGACPEKTWQNSRSWCSRYSVYLLYLYTSNIWGGVTDIWGVENSSTFTLFWGNPQVEDTRKSRWSPILKKEKPISPCYMCILCLFTQKINLDYEDHKMDPISLKDKLYTSLESAHRDLRIHLILYPLF